MFQPSPSLWLPQRHGLVSTIATLEAGKSVCLYAPTGGGKSLVASQLLAWGLSENRLGIFYVNRRLLIPQTAATFDKSGLHYGIRAAGYDDCLDHYAPIQIASADTEAARVFSDNPAWEPHPAKLVVIDEGHLQKTQVIRKVIDYYKAQGAYIVMLTATPIGLAKWVDELVTSGKLQEYRDAGALVPAKVYSISMPDMAKVKRNLTGEFILDGKAKQVYTQTIVTDVIESWKEYNPNAEPTMLFAPGVAESIWFVEQFANAGFRFCHIDANDYVLDGKRGALNRKAWHRIFEDFREGKIQGLSCRFRLREGVDAPFAKHAIFATPIGSLASWIQAAGRVLRAAPGKTHAIITDHGGNYHRFGSPNHEQPWDRLWNLPERAASEYHREMIISGNKPEPICCPSCKMERSRGSKCPGCGFEADRSKRKVVMENGRMIEVDGPLMKPRRAVLKKDTEKKWEQLFWAFKNKKVDRSFNQMWAYFYQQYGYPPPRDMKLCPKEPDGWYRRPHQVPMNELIGK
jgi:superfamily II DNA or RNA helicase